MGSSSSNDFSVVVIASDARPFLSNQDSEIEDQENWHYCCQDFPDQDFSDLDFLQFLRFQGFDKSAPVVNGERLRRYIYHKICGELPEGSFCVVYMHSTVQKEDNSPGVTILRWIYEDLPSDIKDRLQVIFFIHPRIRSRLSLATLGRFFLSGGLYWKIRYISRLQYLWDVVKKGEVEIPAFVQNHDDVLEHRPLTDYGIEPDPLQLTDYAIEPDPLQLTDYGIEPDPLQLTDYGIEPDPLQLMEVPTTAYSLEV